MRFRRLIIYMKKSIAIMILLICSGCGSSGEKRTVSSYDLAIKNLSATSQQLDSIRREKDLYVKVLEDFEKQKNEYGLLLDSHKVNEQMQQLADWHHDITLREREISFHHDLNVYDAQTQAERKYQNVSP